MRLVVSWLRDFVDVKASPEEIAETLGLRGFEVASVEPLDAGDAVIDFEVTANRPDCLSVLGLAREVATAYDLPLTPARRATAGAAVAVRRVRSNPRHDRGRGTVPAVCRRRGGRLRRRRQHPALDVGAPAGGRRAPHQPHRRRDELRAHRTGPADARVRPRQTRRRVDPRAARGKGRIHPDARRRRSQARARHARDRRPRPRAGGGRRHGGRRFGGVRLHPRDRLRERVPSSRRRFAARASVWG